MRFASCWVSRTPRHFMRTLRRARRRQRGARSARGVHGKEYSLFGGRRLRQSGAQAEEACATLLAARGKRPRPHLDDKILTAWNGLMISAFALGGRGFGRAALCGGGAARGGIYSRAHVCGRHAVAAISRRRCRNPGVSRRLRAVRAGAARSLRGAVRRAPPALGDRTHPQDARAVRRRGTGRILQLARGRRQPGDARERRLRWRRAFRQFRRGDESAAAGADDEPRRISRNRPRAPWRRSNKRLSLAPSALPQMLAACEFLSSHPRQIVVVGDRSDRTIRRALLRGDPRAVSCRTASCC